MSEYDSICYITTVGLNELPSPGSVSVIPNPVRAGQSFMIKSKDIIVQVDMINLAGSGTRIFDNFNHNSAVIGPGFIPPGVYLIRAWKKGGIAGMKKLVIL